MRVRLTGIVAASRARSFVAALLMAGSTPRPPAACACAKLPERDDGTIHVVGCMADTARSPRSRRGRRHHGRGRRRQRRSATDTSEPDGRFDIPLGDDPRRARQGLYVVKIDKDSLPDGRELRNPDQLELHGEHQPRGRHLDHLPDRRGRRRAPARAPRRSSCSSAASSSRVLLAMAALGLSMIFGTTGLTNFAHGELITFGALVAFTLDQLPGQITHRRHRRHRRGRRPRRVRALGGVRLAPGLVLWATAAQARHRPDRDDDRQHRPVHLPAQRLPVLRRRRQQELHASSPAPSPGRSARS